MRNFQWLLLVLKRSYICYYIICMTVTLIYSNTASIYSLVPNCRGGSKGKFLGKNPQAHLIIIRRSQLNFLLYKQSGELFRVGRSVDKIIIIRSFRIGKFKNKNIDHWVKETLCQYKLHMKPTRSLSSVIQRCQVHQILFFLCILL